LSLGCGCNRLCRGPKNDEEGIAPCANLDATMAGERLAEDTSVLRKGRKVSLAQLTQQQRRSLYVGEEEGDGP
jgi:hypothetical protein